MPTLCARDSNECFVKNPYTYSAWRERERVGWTLFFSLCKLIGPTRVALLVELAFLHETRLHCNCARHAVVCWLHIPGYVSVSARHLHSVCEQPQNVVSARAIVASSLGAICWHTPLDLRGEGGRNSGSDSRHSANDIAHQLTHATEGSNTTEYLPGTPVVCCYRLHTVVFYFSTDCVNFYSVPGSVYSYDSHKNHSYEPSPWTSTLQTYTVLAHFVGLEIYHTNCTVIVVSSSAHPLQ
jgi:hypothetical protein